MNIPISITLQTKDVGATQRVTFYMNGEPMVAFRPGTRHEEVAAEVALKEFNFFISTTFGKYLRSTNIQGLDILPTHQDLTDPDYY
jgi:hypothetical protein